MAAATAPVILSVRISPNERRLLEAAAAHAHTNLSDFVRRKAIEAAEADLVDRALVTIPHDDWNRFEEWASAPAKDIPALRRLAATQPAWED